jgi:hypothetical protein
MCFGEKRKRNSPQSCSFFQDHLRCFWIGKSFVILNSDESFQSPVVKRVGGGFVRNRWKDALYCCKINTFGLTPA